MNRPRVVLADDHGILLEGLRLLLEAEVDVVAVARDGIELVDRVSEFRPDVAVVDISMPRLNGLDAFKKAQKLVPTSRFIILTANADVRMAAYSIRAGAFGYVLKQSAADELLLAVHAACAGRTFISPRIASEVFLELSSRPTAGSRDKPRLTAREREVLQLLAEGRTLKEAAVALAVSPRTVEFHRNNIAGKTGLKTLAELARYASREGLVQ
jgi:DNA-binding NarL/FixJ family response regulator